MFKIRQTQRGPLMILNLRTFSDLGGGKFRLFISKVYLKFRKETTELINIYVFL